MVGLELSERARGREREREEGGKVYYRSESTCTCVYVCLSD